MLRSWKTQAIRSETQSSFHRLNTAALIWTRVIFDINGWRVWYLPVINPPGTEVAEFSHSQVELRLKSDPIKLPHEFEATSIDTKSKNYPSCRLQSYDLTEEGRLVLTLSKTSYHDYLKSGEHLADLLPNERTKTFRDHFGQLVVGGRGNIRPSQLSNICGVGVFIISSHCCPS